MKIITKYLYEDGTEMKEHDLVYLEGYDSNEGATFSGICKVASCDGELFSAYLLGQKPHTNYDIEIYIEDIRELVKLDSKKIDEVLEETIKKLK